MYVIKTEAAFDSAHFLHEYVFDKMSEKGYNISKAIVYETPRNCAAYSKNGDISYEL